MFFFMGWIEEWDLFLLYFLIHLLYIFQALENILKFVL